jgi:hypothetical protein
MLPIPGNVLAQFNEVLKLQTVNKSLDIHYRKWLLYFLDFCRKYPPPESKSEQVRLFIEKLKSKKQTPQRCTQAAHAISLYLKSQELKNCTQPVSLEAKPPPLAHPVNRQLKAYNTNDAAITSMSYPALPAATVTESGSAGGKRFNEWRCLEKTKSMAWDQVIEKLAAEIKVRHYSRKTQKTYADWGRKFQRYLTDNLRKSLLLLT